MKVSGSKVGGSGSLDTTDRTRSTQKTDESKEKSPIAQLGKNSGLSTEKVNLSSRVQDMQRAKDIASKGANDVDEAKVARLQALIDAGKYKVDAEAIADRLVDEHLNMPT